jgi:hypothetical protein
VCFAPFAFFFLAFLSPLKDSEPPTKTGFILSKGLASFSVRCDQARFLLIQCPQLAMGTCMVVAVVVLGTVHSQLCAFHGTARAPDRRNRSPQSGLQARKNCRRRTLKLPTARAK